MHYMCIKTGVHVCILASTNKHCTTHLVVFTTGRRRKSDVDLIAAQHECRNWHFNRDKWTKRPRCGSLWGEVDVEDTIVVRNPHLSLHGKDIRDVHLGVSRGIAGFVGGNDVKGTGVIDG